MVNTILVIDDNNDMRKLLELVLQRSGCVVLHAVNGLSAIRLVTDHGDGMAVVLCDLILPDINGLDLLEALVALSPHLRGILMTGDPDLVPENSPWPLLAKPFSMAELGRYVQRALVEQPDVGAIVAPDRFVCQP